MEGADPVADPYRATPIRRVEAACAGYLREMEADGLVHRKVFHEVPPKVEYSATELGISLDDALVPLATWGQRNAERIGKRQAAE
jgi:DNA-binding HxlR family transcriptional regulator